MSRPELTAAVRACRGATPGDRVQDRWDLLHAIGPALVAAFANSPGGAGRPTGWKSSRQAVWLRLDPAQHRRPDRPGRARAWRTAYARWALDAPLMLVRRDRGTWIAPRRGQLPATGCGTGARSSRTGRRPTADDLAYHLTTLFPQVGPTRSLRGQVHRRPAGRLVDGAGRRDRRAAGRRRRGRAGAGRLRAGRGPVAGRRPARGGRPRAGPIGDRQCCASRPMRWPQDPATARLADQRRGIPRALDRAGPMSGRRPTERCPSTAGTRLHAATGEGTVMSKAFSGDGRMRHQRASDAMPEPARGTRPTTGSRTGSSTTWTGPGPGPGCSPRRWTTTNWSASTPG